MAPLFQHTVIEIDDEDVFLIEYNPLSRLRQAREGTPHRVCWQSYFGLREDLERVAGWYQKAGLTLLRDAPLQRAERQVSEATISWLADDELPNEDDMWMWCKEVRDQKWSEGRRAPIITIPHRYGRHVLQHVQSTLEGVPRDLVDALKQASGRWLDVCWDGDVYVRQSPE